jgi:hypothetical protein
MTRYLMNGLIRLALVALAGSCVLFGAAVLDAMRLDPLPAPESSISHDATSAIVLPDETAETLLDNAVANDPFQPTREAPAARYGAATIPVTVQDAAAGAARPAATIRLLGTVIDRDGASFALCQLEGAAVKIVHTGQQIGAYKLRSITPGSAVFVGEDGAHLELKVSRSSN